MRLRLPVLALLAVLPLSGGCAAVHTRGMNRQDMRQKYDERKPGSLKVGDAAPDLNLVTLEGGAETTLAAQRHGRPLVLIFGSFT